MKAKFTKLAIIMSAVLVLMSGISVVGTACFFCDEEEPEEPVIEEVIIPEDPVIPNTDAIA